MSGRTDIPLFKVHMGGSCAANVQHVLESGFVGEGPRVREFELQIGQLIESEFVVATNSATSAIYLALSMVGVEENTEVITTPVTAIATNAPIAVRKARIRWADVDPSTGTIDPRSVSDLVNSRTRAIIAVDLGGMPALVEEIRALVRDEIPIVEDAAQAFGASRHDRPLGIHARFTAFSFQGIKLVTCGDGGALVCNNSQDYDRAVALRWFGLDRRLPRQRVLELRELDVPEPGLKLHMNDVSAAIGLGQLSSVDELLAANRRCATLLTERLLPHDIELGGMTPGADPSWWTYWIHVPDPVEAEATLVERGVACSQLMARNDRLSGFGRADRPLPGVDAFFAHALAIPCGWWLSDEDIDRVASTVIAVVDRQKGTCKREQGSGYANDFRSSTAVASGKGSAQG